MKPNFTAQDYIHTADGALNTAFTADEPSVRDFYLSMAQVNATLAVARAIQSLEEKVCKAVYNMTGP